MVRVYENTDGNVDDADQKYIYDAENVNDEIRDVRRGADGRGESKAGLNMVRLIKPRQIKERDPFDEDDLSAAEQDDDLEVADRVEDFGGFNVA
uniref:Uncharacterized protein n=1 Tax=Panagrolaimus superbus TaxID=310955 RepID=A0A914Z515_9BILA